MTAQTLISRVTLTSPADKAPGIGAISSKTITNVKLDWENLSGATSYRWQLDYDTDFSSVPEGFEGSTKATSTRLPPLEPATRYYWRVRAAEPVLSPWSEKWSFVTSLGTETATLELYTPEASASAVPTRPAFQWSAIAGADSYELVVATDSSFTNPVIAENAVPATAWKCDTDLTPGTTYYWKVRANSSESHSAWSAVSVFTTESGLSQAVPQIQTAAPTPPPAPPPSTSNPDWVKWLVFLGFALLITMMAILITMLIMLIRTRRP
ncbi:hypothetical protein ACFLYR_03765 [Chloroflexota bacterium]